MTRNHDTSVRLALVAAFVFAPLLATPASANSDYSYLPLIILPLLSSEDSASGDHVWPYSGTTAAPDGWESGNTFHTSYGPRMNYSQWNFHDGIDLPADPGTEIKAVHDGVIIAVHHPNVDSNTSARIVVQNIPAGSSPTLSGNYLDENDAWLDPNTGEPVFWNYIHVTTGVAQVGTVVRQGEVFTQVIDPALDPNTNHGHLHLEVRRGTFNWQHNSVHPLNYLPYSSTPCGEFRFGFPTAESLPESAPAFGCQSVESVFGADVYPTEAQARQQVRIGLVDGHADGRLQARIPFGAAWRNDGDLRGATVIVNCPSGDAELSVDLDDKSTLNEALHVSLNDSVYAGWQRVGDQYVYGPPVEIAPGLPRPSIGLEGYQSSQMSKQVDKDPGNSVDLQQNYLDLHYGIVVRDIPAECTTMDAVVKDVRGNRTTLDAISLWTLDSEGNKDPAAPPLYAELGTYQDFTTAPECDSPDDLLMWQWSLPASQNGDVSAGGTVGNCRMRSEVSATASPNIAWAGGRAAVDHALPANAMELWATGLFNPQSFALYAPTSAGSIGGAAYPIYLRTDNGFLAAVEFRCRVAPGSEDCNGAAAFGLRTRDRYSAWRASNAGQGSVIANTWQRWGLHLTRLGTRMATAVAYLEDTGRDRFVERGRVAFDAVQPAGLRMGIGYSSTSSNGVMEAVVLAEDVYTGTNLCGSPFDDAAYPKESSNETVNPQGAVLMCSP